MTFRTKQAEKADYSSSFELVMHERDKNGNPTGKTKTIRTEEAAKLEPFVEYWQSKKTKKNKENKTDKKG